MTTCPHVWTLFCQGFSGYRVYWRVDICVRCYTKREVRP